MKIGLAICGEADFRTSITTEITARPVGRNPTVRRYGVGPVSDGALFFTAKKSAQKKAAPHSPGGLAHPRETTWAQSVAVPRQVKASGTTQGACARHG